MLLECRRRFAWLFLVAAGDPIAGRAATATYDSAQTLSTSTAGAVKGTSTSNVLPFPTWLVTLMWP